MTVSADAGECHASGVDLGTPVTADNCGVSTVTNDAPAPFPAGDTTVTWTVTDVSGRTATCPQTVTVTDDEDPTIVGCPSDITVNADAGGCHAVVSWTEPTADDNCGIQSLSPDHSPGEMFSGTTTVTYTATDLHGNTATCSFDVTVLEYNDFVVDVQLQGVLYDPNPDTPGDTLDRCITFTFYDCSAVPTVLEQVLTFNVDADDSAHGVGSALFTDLDCGDYDCVTAQDALHSLTVRLDRGVGGLEINASNQYVADFTGDNLLRGGDFYDDTADVGIDYVDILDFGVFSAEWGADYGSADTDCDTPPPHADINGDGLVTVADFTFIQINFLQIGDADCCGGLAIGDGPLTRISLAELQEIGLGELSAGDLNHDGWLDSIDIVAFFAGARPEPRPVAELPEAKEARARRQP